MAEPTPLRRVAQVQAPETAREKAFRLEQEAKAAAKAVGDEAVEAFRLALAQGREAVGLTGLAAGLSDELRRLCDDVERRLLTIEAIQKRGA